MTMQARPELAMYPVDYEDVSVTSVSKMQSTVMVLHKWGKTGILVLS